MPPNPSTLPNSVIRSIFSGLLALALAGCGSGEVQFPSPSKSPLFPVTGKLQLADGKPLTEGTIRLIPVKQPGWTATGTVGADGAFAMKTADQGDGAPEGEYRVSITSGLTVPGPKPGQKIVAVPPEYSEEEGSGLKVTVKAGPTDLGTIKLIPGALGTPDAGRDKVRD